MDNRGDSLNTKTYKDIQNIITNRSSFVDIARAFILFIIKIFNELRQCCPAKVKRQQDME